MICWLLAIDKGQGLAIYVLVQMFSGIGGLQQIFVIDKIL